MSEVVQNNPILYFFIGSVDRDISQSIQEIQMRRMDTGGIGYIYINADTRHEDILRDIESNHNRFITKKYRYASEIRVNYVLDADDPFCLEFQRIKDSTEYFLGYLYPAAITTDIFAIMDDVTSLFSSGRRYRTDVLNILNQLQDNTCLVYVLSNVNSRCIYEPANKNNIIYSIALISLLKNFVSLKPEYMTDNFYNERYFKEDSYKCGGKFMTIGYAGTQTPMQIIYLIFITKLLVFADSGGCNFTMELNIPEHEFDKDMLSHDILAGLPLSHLPTESEKKNFTNKLLINRLFGDRLDLFCDLNFAELSNESIINETSLDYSLGFYAVCYITSPEGDISSKLAELHQKKEEAITDCEATFNKWLNQTDSFKKSLFAAIEEYPILLAREYLEFKYSQRRLAREKKLIEDALRDISNIHNNLLKMKMELDALIHENNKIINDFIANDSYLDRDYYESWLDAYLEDDSEEYLRIYQQMYDFMKNGKMDKYTEILRSYVENRLLKEFRSPIVNKSFIMNWVQKNEIYNIFLKTGGKNLHSETNILMDINSKISLAGDKVNLFFENNENQIDIIYLLGGFDREDLYYAELYNREV